MAIGEVCNAHGDLDMLGAPTMEGLIGLPIAQALVALKHGWRWVESHDMGDEQWICVQRGGPRWRVRR
ncbi:hypothetical protein [Sphingobium sp. CFD-1]|uniref:hypothetical protein n=1 Tax=Sphingobium sp. CFD-1 TaxID=2878545 RepID=UPI00214CD0E7|nr:hypothetical protein [Sphingobium sp. CFD-1]